MSNLPIIIMLVVSVVNVIDMSTGLSSNSVRCITHASDGYYYIGTTGSLQILMMNNGLKAAGTLDEVNYADSIDADENGHVATITSDGRLFLLKNGEIRLHFSWITDRICLTAVHLRPMGH